MVNPKRDQILVTVCALVLSGAHNCNKTLIKELYKSCRILAAYQALFRRSYGNANYRPQQHWHYSCSVIRDTWRPWSFVSRLASRWNSWMMMMMMLDSVWQSNRRCESIVTSSDFSSLGAICSLLPATSTSRILAVDRSWGAVPIMTTSDFSARRNHSRTAVEQLASLSRAGPASVTLMATSSWVSSANWWYEMPWDSMSSPTGDTYTLWRAVVRALTLHHCVLPASLCL